MKDGIVLTMRGICKRFPGVMALDRVDFTLRKGEIHALMGENGAGKSTLIKVLTGVYPKDAGEIRVEGVEEAISIRSPQEAQNYGISTVYQEISLCPNLTVAENMFIGRTEGRTVSWKAMEKRAENCSTPWVFRPDQNNSSPAAPSRCSRWWPLRVRWTPTARS